MKALQKDTVREIKKSISRFLSILAIIALGICFFAGVKATGPSMENTANQYYQNQRLMDLRLVSSFGFQEADIKAIEAVSGVNTVMPGYFADVVMEIGDKRLVLKLLSLPEDKKLNQPLLIEGRLPQKEGEVVLEEPPKSEESMIEKTHLKLGDTLKLSKDIGEIPLSDRLKRDRFEVVGFVRSPQYVSIERGSTDVGSGEINAYGFISPKDFSYERFTEVYVLSQASADGVSAFSPEYQEAIKSLETEMDQLGIERLAINRQEIVAKAQEEMDKGKKELEDARTTFNHEIEKGETSLANAKDELYSGENELENAKEIFRQKMASGRSELDTAYEAIAQAEEVLNQGPAELKQQVATGEAELETGRQGMAQLRDGIAQMEANDPSEQLSTLETQQAELSQKIQEAEAALALLYAQREAIQMQLNALDPASLHYLEMKAELETQWGMLDNQTAQIEAGRQEAQAGLGQIQEGIAGIQGFQNQLADLRNQLAQAEASLFAGEEALNQGRSEGQQKLEAGWIEIEKNKEALAQGESELNKGRIEGQNAIDEARYTIDVGWEEYAQGEAQLAEKRAEGEDALAKAAAKIAKGEQKIKDIDFGKFYVFNRDDTIGYSSYGEDAKRIENISGVFPLFFLLVAALVSFTTMTRMVEEQRTQIGTLKALGYSRFQIASKYLIYALAAAVLGSALGLIVGLNSLPYLIAGAYNLLYQMPGLKIFVPWVPTLISCLIAILCTLTAAVGVSYLELKEHPSELMRPKAPKIGKRIFLERLPFIWKHLGFIEKVTARNLMRYKGRFFMTVVGIAGCTALILAGFGLQDSIFSIIPKQFEEITVYDSTLAFKNTETLSEKTEAKELLTKETHFSENTLVYQTKLNLEKQGEDLRKEAYFIVPESTESFDNFVKLKDRKTGNPISLEEAKVVLSEKTAKDLNIKVGDNISVFNENESHEITLGAITENYLGNYLYLSKELYEEIWKQPLKVNLAYVNMPDISKEAEELVAKEWLEGRGIVSINFVGNIVKNSNDSLSSLNIVVLVMLLSAAALAVVVLYNLTNINISERVREIATIRVLGFYDAEVYTYIFRENIILSLIGTAVGLGLGVLLNSFIINTVETDIVMFGRGIDFSSYLFAVLFTMIFTFLVNICMTPMIKKISMVESLKSIE